MPTWLIWVIVIVVVVVVVAALIALTGKRQTANRRHRAEQLREEASTQAGALPESHRQAEELRAKADLAQAEAERAEEHAATAEQGHRVEQASYENKLREADRLDPDVDHRSSDYEPDVWNDQRSEPVTPPRHVASPEDTSVAQRTEDPEAEAAARTAGETETEPRRETP
jgi:FtsZ-interacting cell division protein ZipA